MSTMAPLFSSATDAWATPTESINTPLDELLVLPDDQAAVALNTRMRAWSQIEVLHERSYVERGQIAREFERRMLWRHLDDPQTGEPFVSFTKWMASGFMGCRSTNYEAKRDMDELADVPAEALRKVTKSTIKVLKQLSGSVRKDADVLEDARKLTTDAFVAKIERERPDQHLESRGPMRFRPTASQREVIEAALQKAIEDGAHDRTEALEFLAVDYTLRAVAEESADERQLP